MTDLVVYRYALFLRNLIYKKLRHDENPFDSRFVWEGVDDKLVAELMVFLHLEVASEFGSARFYPQVLEAVQNLVNNYHQVDIPNRPPPEVMDAYNQHLQEMANQTSTTVDPTLLKQTKDKLRQHISTTLPQTDPQTLDFLIAIILAAGIHEPSKSIPQSIQALDDTATVTEQTVSQEELVATVSAAAPVWESTSTDFAAAKTAVAEELSTNVSFTIDYVTTAIFSPSASTTPSPKFEAAAVTATQSPATAATATQTLTNRQAQISDLVTKIRQALVESSQVEAGLYRQLSLDGNLKGNDLAQTFAAIKYAVLPIVLVGHTTTVAAGATPEQVKQIDKFLAHIGYHQGLKELGITNVSASARMAAQKAAANLDFSQLFNSTSATQTFYLIRSTASPRLKSFLQDLQTLETVDFASVAGLADRHFDLRGLDASLDKYFSDKTTRDFVRGQNWSADVFAKFVPAAKPLVAVLKPINKLFFLVIDRTIARPLKTIGYVILGLAGLTTLRGFGLGMGLSLMGWSAARLASRASRVVSAAGTAAVTTFTSFLTVSFIVFLSIPIAVALILFIINNSAYLVPPTGGTFNLAGFDSGVVNRSSCPLVSPVISTYSYNPISQTGHGSNEYWRAVTNLEKQEYCRYSLPLRSSCLAPATGSSLCNGRACEFYGYAIDVVSQTNNREVSLPQIGGQDVVWNFNGTQFENQGTGWSYGYTDSTGKYSLLLTHLEPGGNIGANLVSGTKIGLLLVQKYLSRSGATIDNTHLHLELTVDNRYVQPENYFCN